MYNLRCEGCVLSTTSARHMAKILFIIVWAILLLELAFNFELGPLNSNIVKHAEGHSMPYFPEVSNIVNSI